MSGGCPCLTGDCPCCLAGGCGGHPGERASATERGFSCLWLPYACGLKPYHLLGSLSNVAYFYVCLHGGASSGALGLTLCINQVVPRVLPLVLCGLLVAWVVTSVSRPRCRTWLEPECKHWWGYLPSSTREGGLLAGMPASSCSRVTVYWRLVCLHWDLLFNSGYTYLSSSLRSLISLLLPPCNNVENKFILL